MPLALDVHQLEIAAAAVARALDDPVGDAGDGGVEATHATDPPPAPPASGRGANSVTRTPRDWGRGVNSVTRTPRDWGRGVNSVTRSPSRLREKLGVGPCAILLMPAHSVAFGECDRGARAPAAGVVGLGGEAFRGPLRADRVDPGPLRLDLVAADEQLLIA